MEWKRELRVFECLAMELVTGKTLRWFGHVTKMQNMKFIIKRIYEIQLGLYIATDR